MGVIFGGGSQSVFGSTGAGGLLVKLSAIFGAIFLITSLAYNYFAGAERHPAAESIMMNVKMEEKQAPPAAVATEAAKEAPATEQKSEAAPAVEQKSEAAAPTAAGQEVQAPAAEQPATTGAAPGATDQEKKENAPAQ